MQKSMTKDYTIFEITNFFKEMAFQYGEKIKSIETFENKRLTEVINSLIYYSAYPMIPNSFDLYDTSGRNKMDANILQPGDLSYAVFLIRFNFLSKTYELFPLQSLPEIINANLSARNKAVGNVNIKPIKDLTNHSVLNYLDLFFKFVSKEKCEQLNETQIKYFDKYYLNKFNNRSTEFSR